MWRRALLPGPLGLGALVAFLVTFVVGFAPLFGPPGYEQALVTGFVAPPTAAVAMGLLLARRREAPLTQLLLGLGGGALVAAAAFVSSLLHGLRVGFCGVGAASLHFLLTAGVGSLLGGAWGAFVAEGARRAKRPRLHATVFGLAAPLLSIAVGVARFIGSPMVFGYDPFVGYFAGTLYDTVVEAGTPLLTYRLGTLATISASLFACALFERRADGGVAFVVTASGARRSALAVAAAGAAGLSLAITLLGPSLGHWHTKQSITAALGGVVAGPRCDVVFPDDTPRDLAALMLRDCEEQLRGVEESLGAKGPQRVTAFFFRDAAEKKLLMGAADTYIAKPWRHEVYLQTAPYPHPVLAHELAHVVAGAFGVGPFRVAGRYGGLLPNPGLIEGVAVAAAPDHDALSDLEWSRVMLDLGILPRLDVVFSLGFLGESSAKSYTVAGAAVQWLADTRGRDKVVALYGGAAPEAVFGASWATLDEAFRAHLMSLSVGASARAYAKARFDRPAVFRRRCPHEIDGLVHEAVRCRDALRFDKAEALYGQALGRHAREMPALLGRAVTALKRGDFERAGTLLRALAEDEGAPRTTRDKADEFLGDLDFHEGRFSSASERYRAIAARVLDEDVGRTLEVKALLADDPLARGALEALLLGAPGRGPDMTVALARVSAWRAKTEDPFADYLLGRNLVGKATADALVALRRAARGPLPTARIRREAVRQLAFTACAVASAEALAEARSAVAREVSAGAPSGWVLEVTRQLRLCATPKA